MCQQQQFDMSSQIEVLFENGMPRKLGRSVEKTLQKRAAKAAKAAQALATNNNNNINIRCTNCIECGGCSNPQSSFNNPCVCSRMDNDVSLLTDSTVSTASSSMSSSPSHSDDEELIASTTYRRSSTEELENKDLHSTSPSSRTVTTDDSNDSDGSLVDSVSELKSSSSRKSNRSGCPMAALLAKRAIEPSESQLIPQLASNVTSNVVASSTGNTYRGDILAILTQQTKQFFFKINQFSTRVQKSKTYRVLSKSTQPAHVIAVGILSFVLLAVWPNLLENEEAALNSNKKRSGLALVAYLGAFATHFGAQIWMTFVSGLSLYFALPRHTFGLCQQILFPKYFAMNSMLSILTLILFIKVIAGRWEFSSYVQVIALTICAIIEVAVRLYLAPPLLRLMREKHKFEITIGSGQEVGTLEQGDLVKCPHYQAIHKAFRRIHMTVAMGNLTALVCTFLHLHYLASKISVG